MNKNVSLHNKHSMLNFNLKSFFLLIFIFLLSTIIILLVPKKHEHGNNVIPEYIKLNKFMNFQINVDADHMLNLAHEPSELFQYNEPRQARPLLIIASHLLSKPISKILELFNLNIKLNLNFDGNLKKIQNEYKLPIYLSYVLLNYFTLFIGCLIFINLCLMHKFNFLVISVVTFLLTLNINTKYFLLTPHFQMFNILCPILGLGILNYLSTDINLKIRKLYFLNFLLGFLLLFYSIFINLLFFIICYLVLIKNINFQLIKNIIFSTFLFILPSIIYLFILKVYGSEIYLHETKAANMFVWILDLKLNNSIEIFSKFIAEYFRTLNVQLIIVSFIVLLVVTDKKLNFKNINFFKKEIVILSVLFIFLFLVGFYEIRLSTNLTIPLIFILLKSINFNKYNKFKNTIVLSIFFFNFYFFYVS